MFELDALSNSDGSRGGDCGRHDDLDEDGNCLFGGGDESESPRGLTACRGTGTTQWPSKARSGHSLGVIAVEGPLTLRTLAF